MTDQTDSPVIQNGWAMAAIRGNSNNITIFWEALGTLFLGILAILLLVTLKRERAHNQALWEILLEQKV
jgi:hypothetical protein